ncbi:MAG: hypothetical protein EA391_02285 [Balneolaceae bacterium]|nr:MAG: hypothetical protein EA391_02285 [Balneolaceae bacterium]
MHKATESIQKHYMLLILMILCIGIGQKSQAQSTVNINITGIPGILPSPYFSDFEQNVYGGSYQVQLNIPGNSSVQVRFRVSVSKDGEELINETSLPQTFTPGMHMLSPFPEFVEFSRTTNQVLRGLPSNVRQTIIQGGAFPEGIYTIRVEPVGVGANVVTGAPGIATFMVRYPQPPFLLAPANESVVDVGFPVFSWTQVMAPRGTTLDYEFILVELFDGQNPADAIVSNREHAIVQVSGSTILPYTGELLPLEEGKTYAWQIRARDANDQIPIKNEGGSEINVFTYGHVEDEPDEELSPFISQPIITAVFTPMLVPQTTISGTVNWHFSPSESWQLEEDTPQPDQTRQLPFISNNTSVGNAIVDPNYTIDTDLLTNQEEESGIGNLNQPEQQQTYNAVPVFGGGSTLSTSVQQYDFEMMNLDLMEYHPLAGAKVKAVYEKQDGTSTVLATTTADADGDFTLKFPPSELDAIDDPDPGSDGLIDERDYNQVQGQDNRGIQMPGQSPHRSPPPTRTVTIVVDSPYVSFLEKTTIDVRTNSERDYSVGEISGVALTYRLQPVVTDRETGRAVEDAKVEIFRQLSRYIITPELEPEGWPLPSDTNAEEVLYGQMHKKVAEIGADETATRLFPRKKGANDRYVVRVSARGYNTLTTHLSASPSIDPYQIVNIEQQYQLQAALPIVEGRVLRSDNQAPMKDVPVALLPPGSSGNGVEDASYIAITDSDGRFTIANVAVSDEPYRLLAAAPNAEKYEEEVLLNERGIIIERDPLLLDPSMITVTGRVLNNDDEPVANATVRWAEGGTPVQTNNNGLFITANTPGEHLLQVRKIGHRDVDTTLAIQVSDVPEHSDTGIVPGQPWSMQSFTNHGSNIAQWASNLNNTQSFQNATPDDETPSFNPSKLGFSGNLQTGLNMNEDEAQAIINNNQLNMSHSQFGDLVPFYDHLFGDGLASSIHDAGVIRMNRAVGRLHVTVQDEGTGEAIEHASVRFKYADLKDNTDSDGEVYFHEAPGGTVTLVITPPEGTFYVPQTTELNVSDDGEITYITINLEAGALVTGTVTAAGEPVEGANIRVEGRDDISTSSNEDGTYMLAGVPDGEWTIRAGKSGYVGAAETETFSANQEVEIDFSIEDSEFNIATLLGFDIEVDNISMDSDTTISGAFVNIPSNLLASPLDDIRLEFTNVAVYEDDGELLPVNGEVRTNVSQISGRVFNFVVVDITDSNGLLVRPRELFSSIGYIAGRVEVNYGATFSNVTGWQWPQSDNQYLKIPDINDLPGEVREDELVVFTSDGSFPFPDLGPSDLDLPDPEIPEFELEFGGAEAEFSLFGFDVALNLGESVLKNDGLHLQGGLSLADIPVIDDASVDLNQLWIGRDGSVKEAELVLDPHPEFEIAGWKMAIISGGVTAAGLTVGGLLEVDIPFSEIAQINFSELMMSPDQLLGGTFSLPAAGVDVMGIATLMMNPAKDITLGKVQNQDVYFISGGAFIEMPRYLDDALDFRNFTIRTDGQFSASMTSNFETDFWGLADLTVTGVRFEYETSPAIHVDGQFGLHGIPLVSAQAGGLTYRPGGNISFEELDFEFDLASIGYVSAALELIDDDVRQAFSGAGTMEIIGTPIAAGVGLLYERYEDDIAFGAEIMSNIPPIPIGTFSIDNVIGGFSLNRALEEFDVTLGGRVAIAPGTGRAISLDPLQVTIESGPVITGTAELNVMDQEIADAALVLDFPNRLFDLEAAIGFDKLESINIEADASTRLVVSGAENNSYWMVGARLNASLSRLFDANANILAAWDLNVSAHPEYEQYTSFVNPDYITGGTINGIHLDVGVEFGRPPEDPWCYERSVGEICGYFWNSSRCEINADFEGSNYNLYVGSEWGVGGHARLIGITLFEIDGYMFGSVEGSYNNGIWTAGGTAMGSISASVGSCPDECANRICRRKKVIPSGGSICVSAGVNVGYHSGDGLNVSVTRNP